MQIYLSALGSYFTDVVNKRVQNHDTSSLSANDDKYISKALNPAINNLHEAQSAVHAGSQYDSAVLLMKDKSGQVRKHSVTVISACCTTLN